MWPYWMLVLSNTLSSYCILQQIFPSQAYLGPRGSYQPTADATSTFSKFRIYFFWIFLVRFMLSLYVKLCYAIHLNSSFLCVILTSS